MSVCEMCGSENTLFKTLVEGIELNVCEKCAKHGKILQRVKTKEEVKKIEKKKVQLPEKEMVMCIVDDYSKLIKDNREKRGLKQEVFAKLINEKQNLIHNIEIGKIEPSVVLARKLEKFFKVKLIEEKEIVHETIKSEKTSDFTIGDFIKIKKE